MLRRLGTTAIDREEEADFPSVTTLPARVRSESARFGETVVSHTSPEVG